MPGSMCKHSNFYRARTQTPWLPTPHCCQFTPRWLAKVFWDTLAQWLQYFSLKSTKQVMQMLVMPGFVPSCKGRFSGAVLVPSCHAKEHITHAWHRTVFRAFQEPVSSGTDEPWRKWAGRISIFGSKLIARKWSNHVQVRKPVPEPRHHLYHRRVLGSCFFCRL